MDPVITPLLAVGAYKFVKWAVKGLSTPEPQVSPSRVLNSGGTRKEVRSHFLANTVTVAGRTSVGKSSLCNALLGKPKFDVGIAHGTTSSVAQTDFQVGWKLKDTPGLLDDPNYWRIVMKESCNSKIVAYVTSGQLYRKEVEFLEELHAAPPKTRSILVLLNMNDLKIRTMPKTVRMREMDALVAQVTFIPRPQLCLGSAAPADGHEPDLEDFNQLLRSAMALHS